MDKAFPILHNGQGVVVGVLHSGQGVVVGILHDGQGGWQLTFWTMGLVF